MIPVLEKLLDKGFVNDLKADGTFDEQSFMREYESIWQGASSDAFFNADIFDHNRSIQKAEYAYSGNTVKSGYYVLGVDVGRKSDTSVVMVIKVNPQNQGDAMKHVVNIYTYEKMHLEDQCINIKRLYARYKCRGICVDGNGVGLGLVDYLVKDQIDPDSGDLLPNMGIINDEQQLYRKFRNENTILDSVYTIKATPQLNTEMYSYIGNQMRINRLKFLIDEREAKARLLEQVQGQKMSINARNDYLRPYTLTTILKESLLNLREEHEGTNIILKKVNNKITKDNFSALLYGLWFIKLEEDKKRKRKKFDFKKMTLFN